MRRHILLWTLLALAWVGATAQTIQLSANAIGKRFDGIGAVNGGGATSVLLKDYPEPQRSQIMDMVYKPMFGASVSTILVEVPGDGNSTQGSMPSHAHERNDANFLRGYMWWVMQEAKRRNAALSLDATSWSAPAWVGNFWSDDMADYYIAWLQGLRQVHGLELDALGCHNEKGWNADFAKHLRRALNERGFRDVKLHGFGNWGNQKMDFLQHMQEDAELRDALDAVCAHTFSEIQLTPEQCKMAEDMGKPIWNSEDHVPHHHRQVFQPELHRQWCHQGYQLVRHRCYLSVGTLQQGTAHAAGAGAVERTLHGARRTLGVCPLWSVHTRRLALYRRRLYEPAWRRIYSHHARPANGRLQHHRRNERGEKSTDRQGGFR